MCFRKLGIGFGSGFVLAEQALRGKIHVRPGLNKKVVDEWRQEMPLLGIRREQSEHGSSNLIECKMVALSPCTRPNSFLI